MTRLTSKNEDRRWGGGYQNFYGNHAIIEMQGDRSKDNPLVRAKFARNIPRERLISNYYGRENSNQMPWDQPGKYEGS